MSDASRADRLKALAAELRTISDRMQVFRETYAAQLESVHGRQRPGALNLVDYLAFRGTNGTRLEPELELERVLDQRIPS